MQKLVVFGLLLVGFLGHAAPVIDEEDGSLDMAMLPTRDGTESEVVGQDLVNAGLADEVPDEQIQRGPKVNGGFALNIVPLSGSAEKRVANADCTGYMVDGKCIKPLPKRSRLATLDDNMQSPEQLSAGLYEPDIHAITRQHFHQDVMEETSEHHASMPGFDIIDEEMNKGDASHAQSISDSMWGIGSGLMKQADEEQDIRAYPAFMNAQTRPTRQQVLPDPDSATVHSHFTDAMNEDQPTTFNRPSLGATSERSLGGNVASKSLGVVKESTEAAEGDSEEVLRPIEQPTDKGSLEQGDQEIAEQPAKEEGNVSEEVGDLESTLPKVEVDAEEELPPTPTAEPTPDPVAEAEKRAAEQEHAAYINQSLEAVRAAGYICVKDEPMMLAQTTVTLTDPADLKGNFLSMVSYCTRMATDDFTASLSAHNGSPSQFSQALTKYAAAASCAESDNFPACVPSDATNMIQSPPSDGKWSCF